MTSWRAATAFALALSGAAAVSCGDLPSGERLQDGPAVRRALARDLEIRLKEAQPVPLPTGLAEQAFSYYGSTRAESFLVVVFDRASAVPRVTGRLRRGRVDRSTTVVRHRNVVVFHTRERGGPNRGSLILRSLRHAL